MSRHAAETTFAGLLTYLESFPPSPRAQGYHIRKKSLETIPYPRMPFKKSPHKKPHPKYKDGITILGKTKFGIPVTEEQFVFPLPFSFSRDLPNQRFLTTNHRKTTTSSTPPASTPKISSPLSPSHGGKPTTAPRTHACGHKKHAPRP